MEYLDIPFSKEKYLEFVEEVNKRELTMQDIIKKVGITKDEKKAMHHYAMKIGDVPVGRYCHRKVKNYFFHRTHKMWCVRKVINHFDTYFGEYPTEEMAKRVTELLHECNWDKEQLPRIQMEVWKEYDVQN